jgi:hypothetical protein
VNYWRRVALRNLRKKTVKTDINHTCQLRQIDAAEARDAPKPSPLPSILMKFAANLGES